MDAPGVTVCVCVCCPSQSIAYLLSGNMDQGSLEFQLEAAISKVFSSVSEQSKNRGGLCRVRYFPLCSQVSFIRQPFRDAFLYP